MYFDYIAHPISQDLLKIIEKNPNAFISVFFEANYADEFDEIIDDCCEEIDAIGLDAAEKIYHFTQDILNDERKTLEMEGQNWLMPLHFFLSGEFSEKNIDDDQGNNTDKPWQQAKPNFLSKKENNMLLLNALLQGQIIKTEHQNILLTPHQDLAIIIEGLEKILTEDNFIERWCTLAKAAGQYLETFAEEEDRDDFVADLEEFIQSILLPFLRLCQDEKKHILAFID